MIDSSPHVNRRDPLRPPQHLAAQASLSAWGEALFEGHPNAALLIDAEGSVLRRNSSARWLALCAESTFDGVLAHPAPPELTMAMRAGQPWKGLLQVQAVGGPVCEVLAHILPTADMQGPEARALCLFEDPAPAPEVDASLRGAADAAPALVWLSSCDSMGEWFNKPWCAFTGRSADDLLGRGWMEDVHPEDLDRCLGIQAASFAERQPYSMDLRLRRHDGQYRWVMANGEPRYADNGSFQGYAGVCVDIQERKELEERLAGHMETLRLADRRQSEFLAMLSHELRGPLAPIANVASVLRTMEDESPKLTRLREIVERQVSRMRRLVDDLVDVTRVMQGQVSLVKQAVPVADLLRSAIETSQVKIDAGGHTLRIEQPPLPITVLGDAMRLSQALSNIISNAAKFSEEPSEITVAVKVAGATVDISVRDKGPGISPDFLPHVFDMFSQQDQPRVRALGGLGLGLPLARRMAQLHGGDVKASSHGQGKGAEIVMSLPTLPPAADPRSGTAPPVGEPAAAVSPYRVLLIESNPDTRYLLKLQIELWGHAVHIADNPEEALRVADSIQPDIVLCELGDLHADGPQWVRDMDAKLGAPRPLFAALSGQPQSDSARLDHTGFDALVPKPLRPESLSELFKAAAARPK